MKTNLIKWLAREGPHLKPPVANKLLYSANLQVMAVGGPNQRSDYHVQAGEEFFVQLKGNLVLKVIERGQFKDIAVGPGQTFLLPSFMPHSPQRSADSIGLVFERSHPADEVDGMLWFDGDNIEYEEYFHCVDLGTQLKPIIERYKAWKHSGGMPVLDVSNRVERDFDEH